MTMAETETQRRETCPECSGETSIGMNGSTAATPANACPACGWYEWL